MERVELIESLYIGKNSKIYSGMYLNKDNIKEKIVIKELKYFGISNFEKEQIVNEVNLLRECKH